MKLTKKAFAKINLTLEILGKRRGDGFHDIASVMMKTPELYDEVSIEVYPETETAGKVNFSLILVGQTADAFHQYGFARAIATNQAMDVSFLKGDGYVL